LIGIQGFLSRPLPHEEEKPKTATAERRHTMKKEGTFLRENLAYYPLKSIKCNHLIADLFLTEADDEERIEKLKQLFRMMAEYENDETALELLKLIEKALRLKEKNIARMPDSDGHLGNAAYQAVCQFRDWLMDEIWWKLPSEIINTKLWILEEIINDWRPKRTSRLGQNESSSLKVFCFLITAYNPSRLDYSDVVKYGFAEKSKGRQVSPEEKKGILALFQKRNKFFKSEELEEWIIHPGLPYDIERVLAIARTRNGGLEGWTTRENSIWRDDIKNAKLVKQHHLD